jgi:hypothetical protein
MNFSTIDSNDMPKRARSIRLRPTPTEKNPHAAEFFKQRTRGLTRDASVRPEGVQALIDVARENAKVARPVSVAQVVDYSFVEKARKELGLAR